MCNPNTELMMERTSKQYEWQMMTATIKMLLIWADTDTDAAMYAREELKRRGVNTNG